MHRVAPGKQQYYWYGSETIPIGKAIKYWREKLGKTQRHLTEQTGIRQSKLSFMENGYCHVWDRDLDKIAASLGIQVVLILHQARLFKLEE